MDRWRCLLIVTTLATAVHGCGQDGSGQGEANREDGSADPAISGTVTPRGPSDPAENLEALVAKSSPDLERVAVSCEAASRYPFQCTFTAHDARRDIDVEGGIDVRGVYAPTRTYAFSMQYGPR